MLFPTCEASSVAATEVHQSKFAPVSSSSREKLLPSQLREAAPEVVWRLLTAVGPTMMMALHLPMPSLESANLPTKPYNQNRYFLRYLAAAASRPSIASFPRRRGPRIVFVGKEETEVRASAAQEQNADPEDVELVRQIQRVLELLKQNRDMLFNEVKLTIMIEDPREAERKRLLGIDDSDEVTRDDLGAALEDVNEGRIPENRVALRMLAEEMIGWPNLEVEATKGKPSRSLYAKATDTGVDPAEAAKRLNVDWDSAAEIEASARIDDVDVPPAVGYGALYLVTAFPLIIGISVVLILFYNSLQ